MTKKAYSQMASDIRQVEWGISKGSASACSGTNLSSGSSCLYLRLHRC